MAAEQENYQNKFFHISERWGYIKYIENVRNKTSLKG
jgi:hypothetical protein